MSDKTPTPQAVRAFCAGIGRDPLLVQGAGGNVSWKEGDTLWVKASGTWLAQAQDKDIFVPVALPPLRTAMAQGVFDAAPQVLGETSLRPSIETVLHALMPHRVVVHVHAIEALAHLVRSGFEAGLAQRLGASFAWVGVPYRKPGAPLAEAVAGQLARQSQAELVFLGNHGVVLGADDVPAAAALLSRLTAALALAPLAPVSPPVSAPALIQRGGETLAPVADAGIQQLALNPALYDRLRDAWALYPDHVVFLGAQAPAFDTLADAATARPDAPELAIVRGTGVYALPAFNTPAKLAQLRCYADVLSRQPAGQALQALSLEQVGALLNWDAERYRMSLAK